MQRTAGPGNGQCPVSAAAVKPRELKDRSWLAALSTRPRQPRNSVSGLRRPIGSFFGMRVGKIARLQLDYIDLRESTSDCAW